MEVFAAVAASGSTDGNGTRAPRGRPASHQNDHAGHTSRSNNLMGTSASAMFILTSGAHLIIASDLPGRHPVTLDAFRVIKALSQTNIHPVTTGAFTVSAVSLLPNRHPITIDSLRVTSLRILPNSHPVTPGSVVSPLPTILVNCLS